MADDPTVEAGTDGADPDTELSTGASGHVSGDGGSDLSGDGSTGAGGDVSGDGAAARPTRPAPRPPASAAAAAASRARRIGGRGVSPAPPVPEAGPEPVKPVKAVRLDKEVAAEPVTRAGAEPGAPTPARSTPEWLRWLPATVLTIASLGMVILLVVASHGVWWNRPSSGAVRDQVLAAAKTCVSQTNTYNYKSLDAYEAAGVKCATGVYTGQFTQAVEKIIKKNAPTLKAVQSTQINTAAIESVTRSGQWSVLIFGQIKVTNTNYPNGRTDPFGAVARMEKVHGKWLISGLKTVSSPVASGG